MSWCGTARPSLCAPPPGRHGVPTASAHRLGHRRDDRRVEGRTRLLRGYRGAPPADQAALEDVLLRVSELVTTAPEIQELDLNPVVVGTFGTCVADARVRIEHRQSRAENRRVTY